MNGNSSKMLLAEHCRGKSKTSALLMLLRLQPSEYFPLCISDTKILEGDCQAVFYVVKPPVVMQALLVRGRPRQLMLMYIFGLYWQLTVFNNFVTEIVPGEGQSLTAYFFGLSITLHC